MKLIQDVIVETDKIKENDDKPTKEAVKTDEILKLDCCFDRRNAFEVLLKFANGALHHQLGLRAELEGKLLVPRHLDQIRKVSENG